MATDADTIPQDSEAPTQEGGMNLNEGAETLFGLLTTDKLDQPASDVSEDEPLDDPEDEEPEAPEGEDPEPSDEESEEYDLEDEEVEDESADDDRTDDPPESQTYKVQVDGEELEVTLDEALAGYQRQQAFTKKTQQVAEERKQVRQEVEGLREKQLEYGQALQQAEAFVRAAAPEEVGWSQDQWQDLRQKSPRQYADRMDAVQTYQNRLQAVQQEQQRLMNQVSEVDQRTRTERLQEEEEALVSRIPEWVDEETRKQEQQEIVDYVTSTYDYTPEDLGSVVDHRLVDILRKAMLYDRVQEEAPKIQKDKRKPDDSINVKPGTPPKNRTNRKQKATKAARKRLSKSGRVDDAAAALHGLLD